jgi:hypothetical protein
MKTNNKLKYKYLWIIPAAIYKILSFESSTIPVGYRHPLLSKQDAAWEGAAGAAANEDDSSSVSDRTIILALSRATIDSDMRVSSRQHCSSCTVMCHCWQTAACPRLVSTSSSLACQPWVYCVTVYCVDGWLISRRISKMYPRELCHLTKGFTPIKAMSFNGKNEGGIRCDPIASQ